MIQRNDLAGFFVSLVRLFFVGVALSFFYKPQVTIADSESAQHKNTSKMLKQINCSVWRIYAFQTSKFILYSNFAALSGAAQLRAIFFISSAILFDRVH